MNKYFNYPEDYNKPSDYVYNIFMLMLKMNN